MLPLALAMLALAAALPAQDLALVPYPRQLARQGGVLRLARYVSIGVASGSAADRFAAQTLAAELRQIDRLHPAISRSPRARIVLARANTALGRRLLRQSHLAFPAAARDEGYVVWVTPRQAIVIARTDAGVFYGVQTLRQLIHPTGRAAATLPAVKIVDWPALRWRAVQPDLSRGAIPSLAAFQRDLPLLAELKVNALVLYFENTFAYASLPSWSVPGGAITPAEAARIVALARLYHITVIPEQEAFGHLHLGLREEEYQNLVETPYGAILSPAVPASLDFIGQMFSELDKDFPGPFFHIGADETAGLGSGRSQAMLQSEGPGPLYLNYLKDIDQKLRPYHRQILFWGDIAQAHPELLRELPKDMIAVPWDYGVRASYAPLIRPFTDAGLETWVAPGVSNWSRIFPNFNSALINIRRFVRDGRRLGATGLINTSWDDDGESMFDFTWYGIAYGGAVGWEDQPELARFQNAYDWAMFRADGHDFEKQIEDLDAIHAALQQAIHSDGADSLMWHQAFSPNGQQLYNRMEPVAHQVRLLAEGVMDSLAAHRAQARRNQELLDPVEFGARRFDFLGEKAIYAHDIAALYAQAQAPGATRAEVGHMFGTVNSINGLLQDMRDGVSSLADEYQALWLEGNTPYFLKNILVRYDVERLYWQRQSRRFAQLSAAYRSTGVLPPLIAGTTAPAGK
ncbi:MAG TPA: glycoside hydrolase family 20 zincin-like fold domain-containing protein [Terriglobales bacterium]|nr:glycoside hydrolase family 20 zincin-like fold domain-containing protein [Terriglobales bacterium]HVA64083.1 glycoside hydrolase family 20 zincin-like fold domain-containing protein [Terriglobales bacterium]